MAISRTFQYVLEVVSRELPGPPEEPPEILADLELQLDAVAASSSIGPAVKVMALVLEVVTAINRAHGPGHACHCVITPKLPPVKYLMRRPPRT